MKVFWFDTETTGLDSEVNEILSLAYIIEIEGDVKEKDTLYFRPINVDSISSKALEVNGFTLEQVTNFPHPKQGYIKLVNMFNKYVDKFDKKDKLIPAGQNTQFDIGFLKTLWRQNADKYLGSYLNYHFLDTMQMAMLLKFAGKLEVPDFKLATLAGAFDIEFKAHDAMEDIKTTRKICGEMIKLIK